MSRVETMRKLRTDQTGMVSIMVTLILMIVITLIIIGFATTANRNQREALDRQLGAQAYYAAESGINAAVRVLRANPGAAVDGDANDCKSFTSRNSISTVLKNDASGQPQVTYTCLLVSPKSQNISQASVPVNTPYTAHIDGGAIAYGSLTFSWDKGSSFASPSCPVIGTFPAAASWNCNFALLRVDIVPASNGSLSRINDAVSIFMQPSMTASTVSPPTKGITFGDPSNQSAITTAGCNSGATCRTTITFPNAADQVNQYYVRVSAQYGNAEQLKIGGTTVSGTKATFNGYPTIDATGKATDVTRRIQVQINVNTAQGSAPTLPNFAVQSTSSVCKSFATGNGISTPTLCSTP
jgi:Tfp pilus assembly protein PilX